MFKVKVFSLTRHTNSIWLPPPRSSDTRVLIFLFGLYNWQQIKQPKAATMYIPVAKNKVCNWEDYTLLVVSFHLHLQNSFFMVLFLIINIFCFCRVRRLHDPDQRIWHWCDGIEVRSSGGLSVLSRSQSRLKCSLLSIVSAKLWCLRTIKEPEGERRDHQGASIQ